MAETSEIDNAPHAGLPRCLSEVFRCFPVPGLEVAARAHRVDEVVGHLDVLGSRFERFGLQDVGLDNLGRRSDFRRERLLPPHHAAHTLAARFEPPLVSWIVYWAAVI